MPTLPRRRVAGRAALLAALPAFLLLASCTVAERQVAQQGGQIEELQLRVLRLERAVAEARAPQAGGGADPELNRRVADLGQRLEELGAQVRTLAGRVDASERSPPVAGTTAPVPVLESRLADLALRLEALEQRGPAPAATVPSTPGPATPAPPAVALAPSAPAATGQALYDRAYTTYKEGRYEEAREGFREYIRLHPDTNLTDNAQFWIGETHYDQGQYEQAILEYDKVVQKFPRGDKVASALLKQAFAFDAIGDAVDARILLRKLLREHPSSEQAPIARRKLELLGE
ncbi:MAG: tol-pal system protein YbgF [Deferrisomatales bacterium]|nr:tol-pal system protein YbgF [Deferrisomatales bacterium]